MSDKIVQPEDVVNNPAQEQEMFTVDMKFQVNKLAWGNTMTAELWDKLKNGEWRVLSIGFEMKHGVGALYLKLDSAPYAEDTHAAIMHLAKMGEEMFKAIALRAAHTNQL